MTLKPKIEIELILCFVHKVRWPSLRQARATRSDQSVGKEMTQDDQLCAVAPSMW